MPSTTYDRPICIGYRLRWRSDIWSTNRGAAEVGTPGIRPTTEDDIRHNATIQDKDLLRIIMPFRFRFCFHYRMLRKKAKQPFEASSLKFFLLQSSSSLFIRVRTLVAYERLQIRLSILHAHATFRTRVVISLASEGRSAK